MHFLKGGFLFPPKLHPPITQKLLVVETCLQQHYKCTKICKNLRRYVACYAGSTDFLLTFAVQGFFNTLTLIFSIDGSSSPGARTAGAGSRVNALKLEPDKQCNFNEKKDKADT